MMVKRLAMRFPEIFGTLLIAALIPLQGCHPRRACMPSMQSSAFERYVQSFDPEGVWRGIELPPIKGVEHLPILPRDVFTDAMRIREEDAAYFALLSAYYLSKLDMYYLGHFIQSYPVADRWDLDWRSESATNGCYFIYSNFRIATGVELKEDPFGEWRAYMASVYLEEAYQHRDGYLSKIPVELLERWREEYLEAIAIARKNASARGYDLTLPAGLPSCDACDVGKSGG